MHWERDKPTMRSIARTVSERILSGTALRPVMVGRDRSEVTGQREPLVETVEPDKMANRMTSPLLRADLRAFLFAGEMGAVVGTEVRAPVAGNQVRMGWGRDQAPEEREEARELVRCSLRLWVNRASLVEMACPAHLVPMGPWDRRLGRSSPCFGLVLMAALERTVRTVAEVAEAAGAGAKVALSRLMEPVAVVVAAVRVVAAGPGAWAALPVVGHSECSWSIRPAWC